MGIKSLLKELKVRYPGVVLENVYLGAFKGTRLAWDLGCSAYANMAGANKEALKYIDITKYDADRAVLRSYWIERYYNFVMLFIESGITLVPVFDGPHFRLKDETKEDRDEKKKEREKRIGQLREQIQIQDNPVLLDELRKKMEERITFVPEDWEILKKMFDQMGIPWIQAEFEAEAACARLTRCNITAGVVSEDGDSLAHLSRIMISNVRKEYRRGTPNHKCTCIVLQDVLKVLDFSPTEFVDFCILCGTDYNKRVKNFGFVKCLGLMWKHRSVELVLRAMKSDHVQNNRMSNPELLAEIRGYLLKDFPVNLPFLPNVCFDLPDQILDENEAKTQTKDLKKFMQIVLLGFNQTRVLSTLEETVKILEEFNQIFAEMQKFVLILNEDIEN
jgi:5'-3' exonuclease